jgi:hypothetical protein
LPNNHANCLVYVQAILISLSESSGNAVAITSLLDWPGLPRPFFMNETHENAE